MKTPHLDNTALLESKAPQPEWEYKIVDCKCPTCGEPSAGFIDAEGQVDFDCFWCTIYPRQRTA